MSENTFLLPDVGEGLADAVIVAWLVPEGGTLTHMEPMVEIETAKSVTEIPSPVTGTLIRHGASAGDTLEVGAPLIVYVDSGSPAPIASDSPVGMLTGTEPAEVPFTPHTEVPQTRRIPATPTVRRRAHQLGIVLSDVTATGPGGRVLAADLSAHLHVSAGEQSRPNHDEISHTRPMEAMPPARYQARRRENRIEQLSPVRQSIAKTLHAAWNQVPLITDLRETSAAQLVEARRLLNQDSSTDDRITLTAFFAFVTCVALRHHPELNASLDLDAGTVTQHGAINLGIAVSTPKGLSVGVIADADSLSLPELNTQVREVAALARAGRLPQSRSTGATFTVSSFGQFGGQYGTPLVVPPQVGIAGFGPIADRVVAVDGMAVVQPMLALSVSADHRLIDGAELSGFCSTLETFLSAPIRLLGV